MRSVDTASPSHFTITNEEILVKKLLQTHAPDGRDFNPEALLRAAELLMSQAMTPSDAKSDSCKLKLESINKDESVIIHKISHEILYSCSTDGDGPHSTTMDIFESLERYSWGAKMVLVIAAFALSYGEFSLIIKYYPSNLLASSIAFLKRLSANLLEEIKESKHRVKALRALAKEMVEVTKCILDCERYPVQYVSMDYNAMLEVKNRICITAYWVIRTAVRCAAQLTDFMVNSMQKLLMKQLKVFHPLIESKIQSSLPNLFRETHIDNQKILDTLLSMTDDTPLSSSSSQEKFRVDILRNKDVILFLSRPDISLEKLLLLAQQTHLQPHNFEENYEIVWVPISRSNHWTRSEEMVFSQWSQVLPWYTVRRPWSLSTSVVKYFSEVWNFKDEPLMVVLDTEGRVISMNAIDMVMVWGASAYPFSTVNEEQLWRGESWTLKLLMGDIDPVVTQWVEEGRNICLYGSINIEWIREFTGVVRDITTKAGVQLELLYVGSNSREHTGHILATITREKLSSYLSHTNMIFFWSRLESIKNSKLRFYNGVETDAIIGEVTSLFTDDFNKENWILISEGSSMDMLRLHGREAIGRFTSFQVWGDEIEKVGMLNAIRGANDTPVIVEHYSGSKIVAYVDGKSEEEIVCERCKRLMQKCVLYQCYQKSE
ncbi:hypothetical protein QJS10_CPA16g00341 [Acorus calamus]|uniref:Protein SIEVE ELEMENT OCCLUSION C n=1 Tax=Acorus calamus TaxID=4465 RepID=A0AAV9D3G6_ACOCL|nr:hypothetical protein QJS10_CPA16g00341 [Acorus calamus]